jgi:DNA-directed RNA polymerase subunit M/transcription elongation factor TFIIS
MKIELKKLIVEKQIRYFYKFNCPECGAEDSYFESELNLNTKEHKICCDRCGNNYIIIRQEVYLKQKAENIIRQLKDKFDVEIDLNIEKEFEVSYYHIIVRNEKLFKTKKFMEFLCSIYNCLEERYINVYAMEKNKS